MAIQARPDTVFQFSDSKYPYKGYVGVDHKFGGPAAFGRNQIITVMDLSKYQDIIIAYREQMILKNHFSEEVKLAFLNGYVIFKILYLNISHLIWDYFIIPYKNNNKQ